MDDALQILRAAALALPEVVERPSHGTPAWFVRGKASFGTAWLDGHHDNRFPHVWLAARPGVQEALVSTRPEAFFRPPYVGHRGWVGVRLDGDLDADELVRLVRDAYLAVAPRRLAGLVRAEE